MSDQEPEQDKRVFPPPDKPVECYCLHCGRIYMSDMMVEVEIDGEFHYACPVKGCTAMGWDFDIFSTAEPDEDFDDEDWSEEDDEQADGAYIEEIDLSADDPGTAALKLEEPQETFDPPREWTPDLDREDEFENEFERDEDDQRGTIFTRDEYDDLKLSGELDRKAEEIRNQWRANRDERHNQRPLSDDDIPF